MKCLDYEVVQNPLLLKEYQLIIWGAAEDGNYVEGIFCALGCNYLICDSNPELIGGKSKHGGMIESPSIFENVDRGIVVVTVKNKHAKICIEHMLSRKGCFNFVSLFAVECLERFYLRDKFACEVEIMARQLMRWRNGQRWREEKIPEACHTHVLVYQPGKVASSSVSAGLVAAGVKNTHLHKFFFNDITSEERMSGQKLSIRNNVFSMEYGNAVKKNIKNKKIIVLVRDPVAHDLSRAFHVFARQPGGMLDGYICKEMSRGNSFLESLTKAIVNLKNVEFEWFQKELQELTGIDIFSHEFDRERGYTEIYENGFSVLCMQMEKLNSLENVIGNFVGTECFELPHENAGSETASKYIYETVKKEILFPKKYLDFYYEGNAQMEYFYLQSDIERFKEKWYKNGRNA